MRNPTQRQLSAKGHISIPAKANSIVLLTDSRISTRFYRVNQAVTDELHKNGIATILFDILTEEEKKINRRTREYQNDIGLFTQRLITATEWLKENEETSHLKIGYFATDNVAAGAIAAAAVEHREIISAIVSLSGKVDPADKAIHRLESPILFIVGEKDKKNLSAAKKAAGKVKTDKELVTIKNVSHFFDGAEVQSEVAKFTVEWFLKYFNK